MGGEGVLSGSTPKPLPNIFQNVRITNEISKSTHAYEINDTRINYYL